MKGKKAFSLVELMVVIAIIGILSAIAVPSYRSYVLKSQLTNVLSVLDNYKMKAMSEYSTSGTISSQAVYIQDGLIDHVVTLPGPTMSGYFTYTSTPIVTVFVFLDRNGMSKYFSVTDSIYTDVVLGFIGFDQNSIITWQCQTGKGTNAVKSNLLPSICITPT
jgi:prepilin-type N-terminal cleavage/methylation domain-containing protein